MSVYMFVYMSAYQARNRSAALLHIIRMHHALDRVGPRESLMRYGIGVCSVKICQRPWRVMTLFIVDMMQILWYINCTNVAVCDLVVAPKTNRQVDLFAS